MISRQMRGQLTTFSLLPVLTGFLPIKPEVDFGGKTNVILGGKHGYSGSNEGSTVSVRQLPVLTGNESSDRKSVVTIVFIRSTNLRPESFIGLAQVFQNHP